ncbi:hypothetical protein CPT_Moonbeam184 [Bacillus phage Moonbeam]|uniref:Uncharacterized protein n=1 Tax=Bacillus phage Moonbeam TaxID=1540091 RepID=A0A0A0RNJ4_9CAUD|nr:hypothetical protein CPT_Moonbeam184 [Bacillus phage Moonbeam]AIW03582.1 hypothetical protein CPT_Moonbeam184 [Bacillus phage Moonbeam]
MITTGLVTIAGGISLMMAVGSGAVAALKWFNSYEVDFSKKRRSEGSSYSPGGYGDSHRQRISEMRKNNGTNIK